MIQRLAPLLIACTACALLAIVPRVLSSPTNAPVMQRETRDPNITDTPVLGYLPMLVKQPTLTPTATPTDTPIPTPTRDPALCAEEYPTVCIPPPPPDLDCADIEFHDFIALPPDRHHFDTDKDGIGCET